MFQFLPFFFGYTFDNYEVFANCNYGETFLIVLNTKIAINTPEIARQEEKTLLVSSIILVKVKDIKVTKI